MSDATSKNDTDHDHDEERDAPTPPRVRTRRAVHITVGGTPRHIGHLADVLTRDATLAYVTTRATADRLVFDDTTPVADGAYAVLAHTIDEVQRLGARTGAGGPAVAFIHETDTGDVLEYDMETLVAGPPVPAESRAGHDPARYVTRTDARHVWPLHAPDPFYVDGGPTRDASTPTGGDDA